MEQSILIGQPFCSYYVWHPQVKKYFAVMVNAIVSAFQIPEAFTSEFFLLSSFYRKLTLIPFALKITLQFLRLRQNSKKILTDDLVQFGQCHPFPCFGNCPSNMISFISIQPSLTSNHYFLFSIISYFFFLLLIAIRLPSPKFFF